MAEEHLDATGDVVHPLAGEVAAAVSGALLLQRYQQFDVSATSERH